MRFFSLTFAASTAFALVVGTSHAQSADSSGRRAGFYLSFGLGYGMSDLTLQTDCCTMLPYPTKYGLTGYFALGGTPNPHLRLGVQSNGFTATLSNGVQETVGFFTAAVAYYPSTSMNLWLRGNLGWGGVVLDFSGMKQGGGNLALGFGVGYDWFPGRSNLAIIPWIAYLKQVTQASLTGSNYGELVDLLQIGVGVGLKH